MSETASVPDMLDLALAYAKRGWRVFPLTGKVPAIAGGNGCLDATTDPEVIYEWWRDRPSANVGIACGEQTGVLAIDLDGPEARAAWLKLCAHHDPIVTPWSRTGRADGGIHVLFRWPDGEHVPNRSEGSWPERFLGARKMGVIGEGRYIVAPGSVHPDTGALYAWGGEAERMPLALVPAWLLSILREEIPKAAPSPTWRPSTERDASRARSYCLGALRHGHDEVARLPKGERNASLVKVAYALGGYIPTGFLEEHEVREALRSACAHWSERDVRKDYATIERGMNAGMSAPRDIPQPTPKAAASTWTQPEDDTRTPDQVVPLEPQRPAWKTPAERALTLGSQGARLSTGFPTLDEWSRGGLLGKRLVAIGGAPGAGKTTLALQLAHHYHDAGHAVAVLASDEDADGLLMRWGQQCGLTREDLEGGNEHARAALSSFVDSPILAMVDADDESAAIEDVAKWVASKAEGTGRTGVLIIDSIQTARCANAESLQPRERVDATVVALKRSRRLGDGLLVIATSEVARGFYRGGSERTEPLAAFKESGGIEYGLDLAIVLDSVKGEHGQVDVYVPKSRLGRSDRFEAATRMTMDFARAKFSEIRKAEPADPEAVAKREAAAVAEMAEKIMRALVSARGDVVGVDGVNALLGGANRQRVTKALAALRAHGRIVGGGRGMPIRVVSAGSEVSE